jgi:hypothetical protein
LGHGRGFAFLAGAGGEGAALALFFLRAVAPLFGGGAP